MKNEQHIESFDNLFKDTFSGAKTTVPPGVWEGVAASTSGAAITGAGTGLIDKLIGFKGAAILGAAVVITAAVFTVDYVSTNKSQEKDQVVTVKNDVKTEVDDVSPVPIPTQKEMVAAEPLHNNQHSNTNPIANENVYADVRKNAPVNSLTTGPNNPDPIKNSKDLIGDPRNEISDMGVSQLISSSERICLNEEASLTLVSKHNFKSISWYLNDRRIASDTKNLTVIFTKSGLNTIRVKAVNQDGKLQELQKIMDVQQVSAGFEHQIIDGQVHLTANNPGISNTWFINNVRLSNTTSKVVLPKEDQASMSVIHVTDNLRGCKDTLTKQISLSKCVEDLTLANSITPYFLDGINDEWIVDLPKVDHYYLVILSPDGNVALETTDQLLRWNGKKQNNGELMPCGTYAYQLVYECQGISKTMHGKITLLP